MPIMMEQHTDRYIDKIIIAETRTKWHGTMGRCEHPDLLRISFQPEDQTGRRHFRATQTELKRTTCDSCGSRSLGASSMQHVMKPLPFLHPQKNTNQQAIKHNLCRADVQPCFC